MSQIQDDPFKAYERYLRKKDYKKAIRTLEHLISQYPKDINMVAEIIDLAVTCVWNPKLAHKWLLRLIRMRALWIDYCLLSKMEAYLDNLTGAREYLRMAKSLQKQQPQVRGRGSGMSKAASPMCVTEDCLLEVAVPFIEFLPL